MHIYDCIISFLFLISKEPQQHNFEEINRETTKNMISSDKYNKKKNSP